MALLSFFLRWGFYIGIILGLLLYFLNKRFVRNEKAAGYLTILACGMVFIFPIAIESVAIPIYRHIGGVQEIGTIFETDKQYTARNYVKIAEVPDLPENATQQQMDAWTEAVQNEKQHTVKAEVTSSYQSSTPVKVYWPDGGYLTFDGDSDCDFKANVNEDRRLFDSGNEINCIDQDNRPWSLVLVDKHW